jgi:hypothetical protein
MGQCKVYKMGRDYFMDCGKADRKARATSNVKDEKAKAKDAFTNEKKVKAPKLPWMGRPTFY